MLFLAFEKSSKNDQIHTFSDSYHQTKKNPSPAKFHIPPTTPKYYLENPADWNKNHIICMNHLTDLPNKYIPIKSIAAIH